MPSFATGVVVELLEERPGLQRVLVALGDGDSGDEPERAYALTQVSGRVEVGDPVVVNTTAVELGLGTGGWHVIHWNLARSAFTAPGPGHVMKARYTSVQIDAGSTEEHASQLAGVDSIAGMPVVAAGLHSQVPAVAVGLKAIAPSARLAYVMTDGAGLPLALSDLVVALRARGLLDATVTCGQAFGGDHEAVSVFSALAVARDVAGADAAVVAMGPGVVGTASRLGFSAIEVGPVLDAVTALGGRPIAALRASWADPRSRHRGLSHHSVTALGLATHTRVIIPVPLGPDEERLRGELAGAGLDERHDIVGVKTPDVLALFAEHGLAVTSMGRPADTDPVLFACAAAAGVMAAELVSPAGS
ncbi:MAG: DUF3866 family protein [Acidimicrobiia bacterium]